jgi:hypothetical protein
VSFDYKVKDIVGRDEGLSRSMVKPKHKVKAYALIDFHRSSSRLNKGFGRVFNRNLKVKGLIGRNESLSRSMVKTKHKVMLFALIDFHRFSSRLIPGFGCVFLSCSFKVKGIIGRDEGLSRSMV